MKKILVSIVTTSIATAVLVACNGSGTNSSDISSGGASTPLAKAVCTSLNNWQSVGVGMSADQVQNKLGAPARILTTPTSTEYYFERCRAGLYHEEDATDGTPATPTSAAVAGKPEKDITIYFGGVVVISGSRGVISVDSPVLTGDKPLHCEWDLYNYPFNYQGGIGPSVCRTSNNPF